MKEKEYVDKLCKYMSRYFDVFTEVGSLDGKSRIDIVLKSNDGYSFGIEVKNVSEQKPGDFVKHAMQCRRYSLSAFKGFGKIPILMSPCISDCSKDYLVKQNLYRDDSNYHSKWNAFLWNFCNTGEVRKIKDGNRNYALFVFNNKIIYDFREYEGVVNGFRSENYNAIFNK